MAVEELGIPAVTPTVVGKASMGSDEKVGGDSLGCDTCMVLDLCVNPTGETLGPSSLGLLLKLRAPLLDTAPPGMFEQSRSLFTSVNVLKLERVALEA